MLDIAYLALMLACLAGCVFLVDRLSRSDEPATSPDVPAPDPASRDTASPGTGSRDAGSPDAASSTTSGAGR